MSTKFSSNLIEDFLEKMDINILDSNLENLKVDFSDFKTIDFDINKAKPIEFADDEKPQKPNLNDSISKYEYICPIQIPNDFDFDYYLLVDWHNENSDLNFDTVKNIYNSLFELEDYFMVIFFEDRNDEIKKYYKEKKKLSKPADRKELDSIFQSKISIYTKHSYTNKNTIELKINDPINYLEYRPTNNINGIIYNISLSQIEHLYNITGEALFKKNIRKAVKKNKIYNNIQESFNNYIKTYIYKQLKDKPNLVNDILEISDNIDESSDIDLFWFCHNGITFFCKEGFEISGSNITINPQKTSVINGAQTITNFFNCLDLFKYTIKEKIDNPNNNIEQDYKNLVIDALENITKEIFVKAIFIDADKNKDEKYVKIITEGLNTQVPVLEEDLVASSSDVETLNKILQKCRAEILKPGYTAQKKYSMKPLDFAKKYLIIKDDPEPGRSKNLNKTKLKEEIDNATKEFMKNQNQYIQKFNQLLSLEDWWNAYINQVKDYSTDQNYVNCTKYGKNYFFSYYIKKQTENYMFSDNYFSSFLDFYNDLLLVNHYQEQKQEINLEIFKSDATFNKLKEKINGSKEQNDDKNDGINKKLDELKKYINKKINENEDSIALIPAFIHKYFINENINNFRVINTVDYECLEDFSFPHNSFFELYAYNKMDSEDDKSFKDIIIKNYKNSKLYKQINTPFPIFIINYTDIDCKKIKEIKYFSNFSFGNHLENIDNLLNEKKIKPINNAFCIKKEFINDIIKNPQQNK